jgi:hypothetical protein
MTIKKNHTTMNINKSNRKKWNAEQDAKILYCTLRNLTIDTGRIREE